MVFMNKEMIPVKDIELNDKMTLKELMNAFNESGGFTSKKLGEAAEIMRAMQNDKKCYKFFSFPACINSTGTRGVIKDLIKNKKFDAIVTTCGTLDHDLARLWQNYYQGSFEADDADLRKKGINRLGNVFIPNSSYGEILENKLIPMLEQIYKELKEKEIAPYELVWKIGEKLKNEKGKEKSIIYWCWKNKIPMFIPGITDGSVGFQLIMFMQEHRDFKVNVFKDEDKLQDIVFNNKITGALMIGGGISKHHVIWWNQFKDGLDYAVGVTTAVEHDGSLSGARVKEAISWGKVKPNAKQITVEGDATILLPLLASSF